MVNPWASINWAGSEIVASLHHEHITPTDAQTKGRFDDFYTAYNYRHFAISNYYPSDPATSYPLTNLGVTIPADAIGCPNAEHFAMSNADGHFCAIGSTFASGSSVIDDPPDGTGYGGTWQSFVDAAVGDMLYADGGGISINHPHGTWPGLYIACQMLDYNDAVLGLEIYNGFWRAAEDEADFWKRWALQEWHDILVTGRRCFGLGASDRGHDGRNMLIVPDMSAMTSAEKEEACLQAYRNGHFYVATFDTALQFTGLTADANSITVTTNNSTDIRFGFARAGDRTYTLTEPVTGTEATYTLTGDEVYVWAEGYVDEYESIISQPVMFKTVEEVTTELRRRRARRFAALG